MKASTTRLPPPGRRQSRHDHRPAAPQCLPVRLEHLGRAPSEHGHDRGERGVQSADLQRDVGGAGQHWRGERVRQLRWRAVPESLVSRRRGQPARGRGSRSGRPGHELAVQLVAQRSRGLPRRRRLVLRIRRQRGREHRAAPGRAARNRSRARLLDLHEREHGRPQHGLPGHLRQVPGRRHDRPALGQRDGNGPPAQGLGNQLRQPGLGRSERDGEHRIPGSASEPSHQRPRSWRHAGR